MAPFLSRASIILASENNSSPSVIKGELLSRSNSCCSKQQQCYEPGEVDYLMSSGACVSAGTTMTASTTSSSSSSSSYSEVWPVVGPSSSMRSGGSNNNNNYEMELLLDDIHTSLNMVDDCFESSLVMDDTNNLTTRKPPQVLVAEQQRGAPEAAFLWGLNNGTTAVSSASSSPTWGVIGETTSSNLNAAALATPSLTNREEEPQQPQEGTRSRLHSFVNPTAAGTTTLTSSSSLQEESIHGSSHPSLSSFASPVTSRYRSSGSLVVPNPSVTVPTSSPPIIRSNSYQGKFPPPYYEDNGTLDHPQFSAVSQLQQQQQAFVALGYDENSYNHLSTSHADYCSSQQPQFSMPSSSTYHTTDAAASPMYFHDPTQFMILQQQQQQQQQRSNNRTIGNCYGNYSAAVGYYNVEHQHHHAATSSANEMMNTLNGLILADHHHHHHSPYPTTPQMHRSNSGTISASPIVDHSPMAHNLCSMNDTIAISSPTTSQLMVTSISSLVGQIRRLSRDQMGCRMLQQALATNDPEVATTIFNELLPYMADLMMDPFGNYLFQKLLDCISLKEREMLVKTVSARLVQSSLNLHGTRSVQKIIDTVSSSTFLLHHQENVQEEDSLEVAESKNRIAFMLATALKPAAARLCVDSHGNHVMQRILSGFPPQHTAFIYECVATNVTDVARHRHGCCVIQRCLDSHPHLHFIDEKCKKLLDPCSTSIIDARTHLIQQICAGALQLMQDAYGNYVVQYVLDICVGQPGEYEIIDSICRATIGQVALLSVQKFSSNVIEKCLEKCSADMRELYLEEICSDKKIRELMTDPFGNYVVQRALGVASHTHAIKLVDSMKPHLVGMKNTAPGRRIIGKILRRFPSYVLDTTDETKVVIDGNDEN